MRRYRSSSEIRDLNSVLHKFREEIILRNLKKSSEILARSRPIHSNSIQEDESDLDHVASTTDNSDCGFKPATGS